MSEKEELKNIFIFTILGDKASSAINSYRPKNEPVKSKENIDKNVVKTIELLDNKLEVLTKKCKQQEIPKSTYVELKGFLNTKKYDHYYLTSEGTLIQKLATEFAGIPKSNVKVFCFGNKTNFEVCQISDNKSIIQLGFQQTVDNGEEKYLPKLFITQKDVDYSCFHPFTNFHNLRVEISNTLYQKNTNAKVILFLADFGKSNSLDTLTYLQIYLSLLNSSPRSIRIFDDSRQSQNMGYYIKIFNNLIERVKFAGIQHFRLRSFLPIFDVASSSGLDGEEAFDYVNESIETLRKATDDYSTIILLADMYKITNETQAYRRILRNPESEIDELMTISFPRIVVDTMKESGIRNIKQYKVIDSIFAAFASSFKESFDYYTFMRTFDMESVNQARSLYKADTRIKVKELFENFALIDSQEIDNIDFSRMYVHPDLRVLSSAPRGGYGVNYPSVRIDDSTKAIVGSPAMSAFVEEVFMNSSSQPIKKSTSRKWMSQFVSEFRSNSYSNDHLVFLDKKKSVDEIMHEIGYVEWRTKHQEEHFYSKSDDFDDYYSSDESYKSTASETKKKHIGKDRIEKLQRMVVMTQSWGRNVFNVWLHQFRKKVRKRFEIEFDPNEEVQLDVTEYTKFLRTYTEINKYIPITAIHENYDKLAPQIEKMLRENRGLITSITQMIAGCFDDADRVVTPMFFPGKETYISH